MRTYPALSLAFTWLLTLGGCGLALGLDDFETSGGDGSGGAGASSASSGSGASGASSTTGTGASGASGSTTTSSGPGSGGSGAQGGAGGAPGCPSTHTCVPPTPAEWTGPLAMFSTPTAMGPAACVGAYGSNTGDFHADLAPGTASCDCNCSAAQGIQCTTPATLCFTNNCLLICNTTNATLNPGACTNIGGSSFTKASVSSPAPTNVGNCTSSSNHVLPTPTWGSDVRACGGAQPLPDVCNGAEICTPLTPGDAKMCIQHAGDVACPDPFYADKQVAFESFVDTRACSACSCGAASSTCGGKVNFTTNNCSILLTSVNAGLCGDKDNGSIAGNATYFPTPSGTCPPAGGQLSGSVAEQTPVTFCCH